MRLNILIIAVAAALIAAFWLSIGGSTPKASAAEDQLLPVTGARQGQLQVVDDKGQPSGLCPLKHTSVTASVSGAIARVNVQQEFVNPARGKIEAIYVFPLPDKAAVDYMEMRVGQRTVIGEIKKRGEARTIYENARQAGYVASLLDQERPNIFTQSVANIEPGEKVWIKISYIEHLRYEDGQFEFVFPMVVGPRYIPRSPKATAPSGTPSSADRVVDASKISPPVTPPGTRAGHDISIKVQVEAGVPVADVKSVLHKVNVNRKSQSSFTVSLKDQATIPNRDFILRYLVAGEGVRSGVLSALRGPGDGYFSIVITPPKAPAANQVTAKEMVFVMDTSGSQQGWPLEKSKETLIHCVENMNAQDTFQVLAFNNEVQKLFESAQPATAIAREKAKEFLTSKLGSGGTEMLKAVLAALQGQPDPKRMRIVVFMTDGYVGNDMEILDQIGKHLGKARMFPFGIGNSVNRFLIDGMAEIGRGAPEYVTLAEPGQEAARRFYDRIAYPVLTDINIDWGGVKVQDVYPKTCPDLFSSQPLVLTGRYSSPQQGTIAVSGKLGGRPWTGNLRVRLGAAQDANPALATLWARARLADLTSFDYANIQTGNPDAGIEDQVTRLALEYNLMSQFTSFVAVEQLTVTKGGKLETIRVPVEMPDGVSYSGVFGDKIELGRAASSATLGTRAWRYQEAKPSSPHKAQLFYNGVATVPASAAEEKLGDMVVMDGNTERGTGEAAFDEAAWKKAKVAATLDPVLSGLAAKLDARGNAKAGAVTVTGGRTLVSISLSDDSQASLDKLKALGFQMKTKAKVAKVVIGLADMRKLEELASLTFVLSIKPV